MNERDAVTFTELGKCARPDRVPNHGDPAISSFGRETDDRSLPNSVSISHRGLRRARCQAPGSGASEMGDLLMEPLIMMASLRHTATDVEQSNPRYPIDPWHPSRWPLPERPREPSVQGRDRRLPLLTWTAFLRRCSRPFMTR
ncbi:hypothetical protein [Kribbella sp. DT2]|uniref:hypothetical protein n=1 Tax=Kribbella sp. DT2 TaxID=3393427 RepID=UPI003CEE2E30